MSWTDLDIPKPKIVQLKEELKIMLKWEKNFCKVILNGDLLTCLKNKAN